MSSVILTPSLITPSKHKAQLKSSAHFSQKTLRSLFITKSCQLVLFTPGILTKHINALWESSAELFNIKVGVKLITTVF
jgi:hypothetical protein